MIEVEYGKKFPKLSDSGKMPAIKVFSRDDAKEALASAEDVFDTCERLTKGSSENKNMKIRK